MESVGGKNMEVVFYHETLCCGSYEKQANAQGYTLGDKAELFDEIANSYNTLWAYGYLTEGQVCTIRKKIHKKLINNLKPLEKKEEK